MPLYATFHVGLKPVFEQLGVPWRKLPFNSYYAYCIAAFIVIAILSEWSRR
jgi:hypothetical protein